MRPPAALALLPFVSAAAFAAPAPLLRHDFDTPATQWAEMFADTTGPTVFADAQWIDVPAPPGAATPTSPGLVVTMDSSAGAEGWEAFVLSGPLALKNTAPARDQLALAFTLAASAAHPVIVRIESLDTAKNPTGGLEARVTPAAPDTPARHTLPLTSFRPFGPGAFDPAAPFVQLTFAISSPWPLAAGHRLAIDDVACVATPASP